MTIYVDDVEHRFGRMVMCHMWSDRSTAELVEFAVSIGVAAHWLQQPPKASWVHFDIAKSKKAIALRAGAVLTDKFGPLIHLATQDGDKPRLCRLLHHRGWADADRASAGRP